uniref:Uncharacterized protein n=1 Tax=Rangifer tarandus platyrhynchus TaxID=3082113 RepID=A0ACB0EQR4_RANTA|nr:unnamed protein product [Rangifer tarandus platyrhynchus]
MLAALGQGLAGLKLRLPVHPKTSLCPKNGQLSGTDPRRAALNPAPHSLAQSRVSARIQMCQGRLNEVGLLPLLCLCQPWLSASRLSNGRSREPTPSAIGPSTQSHCQSGPCQRGRDCGRVEGRKGRGQVPEGTGPGGKRPSCLDCGLEQ